MKLQIFNPADPITMLSFLLAFETSFHCTGVHEVAAMWMSQFSVYKKTRAVLSQGRGRSPTDANSVKAS